MEDIVVQYSDLPAVVGPQFYSIIMNPVAGGMYHDAQRIDKLPTGTVKLNPVYKTGDYELVLVKYEHAGDTKPQQLARQRLTIVKPGQRETKTPVGNATPSPAKQEAPTPSPAAKSFILKPAKDYGVEETIVVQYQVPPKQGAGNYYSIGIGRPEENNTPNASAPFTSAKGSVKLNAVTAPGTYELRLLESTGDARNPLRIVHRQVIIIGELKKDYVGRYNCNNRLPVLKGKVTAGAPSTAQIVAILNNVMPAVKVTNYRWLKPEDVCLEFSSIQYLPKTKIKTLDGMKYPGQATLTAYPVKIRYKAVINDYVRKETTVSQEGEGKILYFYKDHTNSWTFHHEREL